MGLKLYESRPLRVFEDVFNDKVSPFFSSIMTPAFKVDISEDDNAIFIEADMPGIKKEDVKVKLDDEVLTVSAERVQSEEDKKKGFRSMERSWGCMSRSFIVGENVDGDKIEAAYENGVLKIRVPKIEPKAGRGKEIPIK